MRMLLAIVLLLPLASHVAAPAWAQQAQPPIRTMAIDGLGEVRARPDMATIMVGVVQQGGTAGEALKPIRAGDEPDPGDAQVDEDRRDRHPDLELPDFAAL